MKKYLANNPTLKERRRELRASQTPAEEVVWNHLRNKSLFNLRFVRQYSLGPYILDFYCPKLKFAIELDGSIHNSKESKMYDKERELYLASYGVKTVRLKNEEVISNQHHLVESLLPLLFIREVETKVRVSYI